MKSCVLPSSFYNRDTVTVAQALLGKKLVYHTDEVYIPGIISETESYRSDDPASHCYRGETPRNAVMFGPVGHAYIYKSYGLHLCLNAVARDTKKYMAGGVLIRAVIPIEGIDIMQEHRGNKPPTILTNGPGKVGQAFGITLDLKGTDMTSGRSPLYIESVYTIDQEFIQATPRIGISVAQDYLWRFVITSIGLEHYAIKPCP